MINLIENEIKASLKDAKVVVQDPRGDGDHLSLTVVSDEFENKNRVERHRTIYNILGSKVGNEIHALSMSLLTKKEASL